MSLKHVKQTPLLEGEPLMRSTDRPHQPAAEADLPRLLPVPRAVVLGVQKLAFMLLGLFVFMLALQLLKQGTAVYGQQIMGMLNISSAGNTLGFGWLLSYLFLSGSPVAAVAISFFAAGTIDAISALTMITGSRLGASFIVLFVGFVYYLRGHRHTASIATGVLALLTTAAIYLPALALGYALLTSGLLGSFTVQAGTPVTSWLDALFAPFLLLAATWLPSWVVLLLGLVLLLTAFHLFDKALPQIDPERSSFRRIGKLVYRPIAMFLLGAFITLLTMSVSVSLSILVPLSIKGLVRRENTLPYIMGANITTFIDTLVAALIVGGSAAFAIVLACMLSVGIVSALVLLLCYRPFERAILHLQEVIVRSRRSLALFLGGMLVVPLLLLLV